MQQWQHSLERSQGLFSEILSKSKEEKKNTGMIKVEGRAVIGILQDAYNVIHVGRR